MIKMSAHFDFHHGPFSAHAIRKTDVKILKPFFYKFFVQCIIFSHTFSQAESF